MIETDVAVIGAGIAGAATARALAGEGIDTLVLEQFTVGHTRGSSHGTSRIFRYSYSDARLVRDCMESLPLWRELEAETGATLYTRTGGFDLGGNAEQHRRALEESGADCEMLDAAEAARRYPGVRFPDDAPILFSPDAGISHAAACVAACLTSARSRGATVREGTRVDGIEVEGSGATLHTSDERIRAKVVVVAAGAWAKSLLATCGVGLDVVVTRETVVYFPFEDGLTIPSVVEWNSDPPFFSLLGPGVGLKAGWHHAGPPIDDPDDPGEVSQAAVEAVTEWVRERFPGARPTPAATETCLYTNAANEEFIMRRHGPVVVGSACSGHGFKFGPLTGLRLAALAREAL